jgi:hypothetical protein
MTKDKKSLGIVLLIAGFFLFSSFKNKNAPTNNIAKKKSGAVFVDQTDAPAGSKQVYSNIGTQVLDLNGSTIYTYDTANIGMTVTGDLGDRYQVVFGDTFSGGITAFVLKNNIQTI